MKIYVCENERYDIGREIVGAYLTLDDAQEKMRVEYDGYKETHKKTEVFWYQGVQGKWGWWTYNGDGFYVTETELMVDHDTPA